MISPITAGSGGGKVSRAHRSFRILPQFRQAALHGQMTSCRVSEARDGILHRDHPSLLLLLFLGGENEFPEKFRIREVREFHSTTAAAAAGGGGGGTAECVTRREMRKESLPRRDTIPSVATVHSCACGCLRHEVGDSHRTMEGYVRDHRDRICLRPQTQGEMREKRKE